MRKKIVKYSILFIISFFLLIFFLLFIFKPINSLADVQKNPEIIITDAQGDEIMHLINNHKITPIELGNMNPRNTDILLHIEDQTFYQHSGFNIQRIFKTIATNISENEMHGASTITQQYIKNIYLSNAKSWSRKLKELYFSIKLEQCASKDEILTGYLNCIYLGNDIYGIANASTYYFNKSYIDLSIKEMLSLVALLNAPSYYSNHLEAWENRKKLLAKVLLDDNVISKEEYVDIIQPTKFTIQKRIYASSLQYFVDATLKEFSKIAIKADFNEKIIIKTRYSKSMNDIDIKTAANIASIAVDSEGFVLSCIGDKDYVESTYNIALNGKRDIGSTIKPLLYYEALKCGYTVSSKHFSGPYSFWYHKEQMSFESTSYAYDFIDMRTALATSDNIYAIKTHLDIGTKTLANHLKKYGLSTESLPSLALGSVGMSLNQLARIYSQFFTSGEYLTFKYIDTIKTNGKTVFTSHKGSTNLGRGDYFQKIRSIMDGMFDSTIAHATGASISTSLKVKCYGKTGLTDFDSYMVGFSDDVLIAVWAGYIDNQALIDADIKRLPKQIFVEQMNATLK